MTSARQGVARARHHRDRGRDVTLGTARSYAELGPPCCCPGPTPTPTPGWRGAPPPVTWQRSRLSTARCTPAVHAYVRRRVAAPADAEDLVARVFHRLLDSESSFRHFVMASMSARIFDLMCALEELATASIEQRVAGYLAKQARGGDSVVVTQAALAAELGTAREVVFRAVRGLRNAGLVSTARGRVHVVDPAGLAAAAAGRRAPPE